MFKVPAYITKVETMSDRGVRLKVDTNELTPEETSTLFTYKDKFGWFLFMGEFEEIKEEDLPTERLEYPSQKTQSQRLRAVIYKLWEQDHGGYDDFELYYRNKTEKIIEWLKEKLN